MKFRITASSLDFFVDVRLRDFGGRWLAVAEISGDYEIGLGRGPHEALAASLVLFGDSAAAALLADPQLMGFGKR